MKMCQCTITSDGAELWRLFNRVLCEEGPLINWHLSSEVFVKGNIYLFERAVSARKHQQSGSFLSTSPALSVLFLCPKNPRLGYLKLDQSLNSSFYWTYTPDFIHPSCKFGIIKLWYYKCTRTTYIVFCLKKKSKPELKTVYDDKNRYYSYEKHRVPSPYLPLFSPKIILAIELDRVNFFFL